MGELSHYGVKGMHWGVRRGETPAGGVSSRKVKKADAKFEKNSQSPKTTFTIYNNAAAHVNKHDIDRINNKAKYKNADFTKPSKLRDQYYKEHQDAMIDALKNAAKDLGTNASGTRRYGISVDNDGGWDVHVEDVKHEAETVLRVVPVLNDRGLILSFSVSESELKHYGVKGMHWGVRKAKDDTPNPRYSARRRAADKQVYGKGGVKRINRRMNKGQKLAKAQQNEAWRSIGKAAIIVGGVQAARIAVMNKDVIAQSVAVRAETKRGQAAAANAMGLPRKATNGPTFSKKSRQGVHKITTL